MLRDLIEAAVQKAVRNQTKTIVCCYARMQPCTKGHERLINAVLKITDSKNADHLIGLSGSTGSAENPLSHETKYNYLKSQFPTVNIAKPGEIKNPFKMIDSLLEKGFNRIIFVTGSDRAQEYQKSFKPYYGSFIKVISLDRDRSSGSVKSISGTDCRAAALSGDFEKFKQMLAGTPSDSQAKILFQEIRDR